MAFYRVRLTQQPLIEGQDPSMDYFKALVSSPDLDDEDEGYATFAIPKNSLPLTEDLEQILLCAYLCEAAIEDSQPNHEITGEEALPYLRYVYNDWAGLYQDTEFEVSVLYLNGRTAKFMWDDRTSIEDMANIAKSYRNKCRLSKKAVEASEVVRASIRTPKF